MSFSAPRMAELKATATELVDKFFELMRPPSQELKKEFKEIDGLCIDDESMIDLHDFDHNDYKDFPDLAAFAKRFRLHQTHVSPKAFIYLFSMLSDISEAPWLVAAVVHTLRASDLEYHDFITCDWLHNAVFKGKYPTSETFSTVRARQLLLTEPWMPPQLTDVITAFELMTTREASFA